LSLHNGAGQNGAFDIQNRQAVFVCLLVRMRGHHVASETHERPNSLQDSIVHC
jgi:hypothetical protein